MPIEGVSFQNSGFQNVTPAEIADQAKELSKAEAQKRIKEPTKSDESKADSEENDNDEEKRDLEGRDASDDEDPENQGNDSDNLKKYLQDEKKYSVKFNPSSEQVEMIEISTGKVIETIAPEDLLGILSNSKALEGIFVDRKI